MRQILITLTLLGFLAGCRTSRSSSTNSFDISSAPKGRTYNEYGDYLIDVGDELNVQVEGRSNISGLYRVSLSGYIALPVAGMVRAKGLSEMQLRDSITFRVRPQTSNPKVSVNVSEAKSYVIFISGKVQKPGTYQMTSKTTLMQGLSLAGGFGDSSPSRVIVVRESTDGQKKRYEASIDRLRSGGTQIDNFWLERGDLIIIEE